MSQGRRVAVFYQYYEVSPVYRDNLVFFLATAWREDIDFFIVLSGDCSATLPERPNITVLRAPNRDGDYGGYCHALARLGALEGYDGFVFVNSTARGPFLNGPHGQANWAELFLGRLQGDVALVGCAICVLPEGAPNERYYRRLFPGQGQLSHVQTQAYAMTPAALRHLRAIGFYDLPQGPEAADPKADLVSRYEIRLSQEIKAAGWDFKCFLEEYNRIDYRLPHEDPNPSSANGDPSLENAFFGRTMHPSEAVFIKSNRNMLSPLELASHTYTALRFGPRSGLEGWTEADDLLRRSSAEVHAALAHLDNRPSAREWRLLRATRRARRAIRGLRSR